MTSPRTPFVLRSNGQHLSHLHATNRDLLAYHVTEPESPGHRVLVEGLRISNCKHDGCFIYGAIIQNSEVSDLRGHGRIHSWLRGCLYENVKLRGEFSGVEIQSSISPSMEKDVLFRQNADAFYGLVALALDISEPSFSGFTIFEGVPANLIKVNPVEHFVYSGGSLELPAMPSWLKLVAKAARFTPTGVVFSLNGASERARQQRAQCFELREKGLLR